MLLVRFGTCRLPHTNNYHYHHHYHATSTGFVHFVALIISNEYIRDKSGLPSFIFQNARHVMNLVDAKE